jgi:hypothetical protein
MDDDATFEKEFKDVVATAVVPDEVHAMKEEDKEG